MILSVTILHEGAATWDNQCGLQLSGWTFRGVASGQPGSPLTVSDLNQEGRRAVARAALVHIGERLRVDLDEQTAAVPLAVERYASMLIDRISSAPPVRRPWWMFWNSTKEKS